MFNKNKTIEQYSQALSSVINSFDGDVAVVRNDACEMLDLNVKAKKRLGKARNERLCSVGYSLIFPELCSICRGEKKFPCECDIKGDGGRLFSLRASEIDWVDGKKANMFFLRDVEDERRYGKKLYDLANYDPLTGIPNRQRLVSDFEACEEEINSDELAGIVAILDLDNFKEVNDTYGHNTGDAMLCRLTNHLESYPEFKDCLYRLGGDEMVLFFKNPRDAFQSEGDMRDYYYSVIKKAMLTYTMPSIDVRCTISIGVAFFPQHGATLTELLRKADIALYSAKRDGRNRVSFFEDKFDTAKKFHDMYISMKPILDKDGLTFGYELEDSSREPQEENVVSLNSYDRALDILGLEELRDSSVYFISFSTQLFNDAVLNNLPKNKFVIEIKYRPAYDNSALEMYEKLRELGYSIAIVDINDRKIEPRLMKIADYYRFDVGDVSDKEMLRIIAEHPDKKFIADGVYTKERLKNAQKMGFSLFEGCFFVDSITKKEKNVEILKSNYLRLLQLTVAEDYIDFDEISDIISSDVALTYKLLHLINSPVVGLRTQISSILMAVAYLGEENLKQWFAILALRGVSEDEPIELLRMSLVRAKFGEALAAFFNPRRDSRHIFLMGLLSLLHIAFDKTPQELMEDIPVADAIKASLTGSNGPYSDIMDLYKYFEYSEWDKVADFSESNNISGDVINKCYINAVKWANDMVDAAENGTI